MVTKFSGRVAGLNGSTIEILPLSECATRSIAVFRLSSHIGRIELWAIADHFLEPLAELLVKLDVATPQEVLPTATKARSQVIEIRDMVHLRFVTETLTGIL